MGDTLLKSKQHLCWQNDHSRISTTLKMPVIYTQILQVALNLETVLFLMAAIACNSLHFSSERGLVLHTVQQLWLSAMINDMLLCASRNTNNMAPCYYAVLHCSFLINNDKLCYDVLQGHTGVQLRRGKLYNIHTLVLLLPLFFVLPCCLF